MPVFLEEIMLINNTERSVKFELLDPIVNPPSVTVPDGERRALRIGRNDVKSLALTASDGSHDPEKQSFEVKTDLTGYYYYISDAKIAYSIGRIFRNYLSLHGEENIICSVIMIGQFDDSS